MIEFFFVFLKNFIDQDEAKWRDFFPLVVLSVLLVQNSRANFIGEVFNIF